MFRRTNCIDAIAIANDMTVADVVNGLNETGLFQHAWDCIEELLRRETTYWRPECIAHMWNVLNDPSQKNSQADMNREWDRDWPTISVLSYVFKIDIEFRDTLFHNDWEDRNEIVVLSYRKWAGEKSKNGPLITTGGGMGGEIANDMYNNDGGKGS
jgi:hypothetical protein